jgi:hypothetical protein
MQWSELTHTWQMVEGMTSGWKGTGTIHAKRRGTQGWMRMLRASLVAIVLASLALAVHVAPVSAAPPTLTANPNPVIVPFGQSTGSTTIKWDSGNGSVPELYLSFNGGADQGPQPQVLAPSGSFVASPIAVGDTYVFKLFSKGKAQLLASVTVKAQHQYLGVCGVVQCIEKVQVKPRGTYVDFSFATAISTLPVVEVSTKTPNPGPSFKPADVVSANFAQVGTQHQAQLTKLSPGVTYHYIITAGDGNGKEVKQTGTFKTLDRHITVKFQTIYLIDDSDALSDGEIAFNFGVLNGCCDQPIVYPATGTTDFGSGDSRAVNLTKSIIDNNDTLDISAAGWDDDDDSTSVDGFPVIVPPLNVDGDFASASKTIDVTTDTLVDSAGGGFTLQVHGPKLQFDVYVSYEISYS